MLVEPLGGVKVAPLTALPAWVKACTVANQLLGKDVFSGYTDSNQDLLLNMVAYLTDENGLITARTKEVKIRPLDKEKLKKERVYWQSLNLVVPIVLLVIFGILRAMTRKRKYANF